MLFNHANRKNDKTHPRIKYYNKNMNNYNTEYNMPNVRIFIQILVYILNDLPCFYLCCRLVCV